VNLFSPSQVVADHQPVLDLLARLIATPVRRGGILDIPFDDYVEELATVSGVVEEEEHILDDEPLEPRATASAAPAAIAHDPLRALREWAERLGVEARLRDPSGVIIQRVPAGELRSVLRHTRRATVAAADTVIHLDPWWNPAVEDQATDRAHRIGQTRPVTVIRLVAQGTIEEAVMALHEDKRQLAESILEGSAASGKLSIAALGALIREGAAGSAVLV
jgi:hypothetical protein